MSHMQARTPQNGFTLIICLVLLAVLTLIGISSVEHALIEEKMSANTQAKITAFQAASSEIGTQFVRLKRNSFPVEQLMLTDISLSNATSPEHMETVSKLHYVGDYERRARRKQQIQSLGASRVLVSELTVVSTMTLLGTSSQQTLGMELLSPLN